MKRQFAQLIVKDIRRLRETPVTEDDGEYYAWLLNQVTAKNDLALDLNIISMENWKMITKLIYKS